MPIKAPFALALQAIALSAALVPAAQALVPVSPADIAGTGALAATCASLHGSGNGIGILGAIDSGLFADGSTCTGQATSGAAGTAQASASRSNALAAGSAAASSHLGVLHLGSQFNTPGGNAAGLFPLMIAQAAFGDTLTVNLPGHTGEAGYLLVGVAVDGVLDASGHAGSAAFQIAMAKNDSTLSYSNPGYQQSTGNAISTDRQTPTWSASSYPVPGPLSEHVVVNTGVVFSIPVTFGTSFELVLAGLSISATRSQTGGGQSSSNFLNTVRWDGVQGVLLGTAPTTGYTLTSASGTDWTTAAAVPEPTTTALLLAGLAGLAWLQARRRR